MAMGQWNKSLIVCAVKKQQFKLLKQYLCSIVKGSSHPLWRQRRQRLDILLPRSLRSGTHGRCSSRKRLTLTTSLLHICVALHLSLCCTLLFAAPEEGTHSSSTVARTMHRTVDPAHDRACGCNTAYRAKHM